MADKKEKRESVAEEAERTDVDPLAVEVARDYKDYDPGDGTGQEDIAEARRRAREEGMKAQLAYSHIRHDRDVAYQKELRKQGGNHRKVRGELRK